MSNDVAEVAEACMFMIGVALPGKIMIGLLYILDFYPQSENVKFTAWYLLINACLVCMIPTFFELVSRDSFSLLASSLIATLCTFLFTILFLPESPRYQHQEGEYQTCRKTLEGILKLNGQGNVKLLFRFEDESE